MFTAGQNLDYTPIPICKAGSELQACLSLGPIFSVEELKVRRREVTQEGQIPANGQAGARTGLWVLSEASLTTPPLLFPRAGVG